MIVYAVSTALYAGIITVVAPYDEVRYYFCIFGYGVIVITYFVAAIVGRFIKNTAAIRTAVAAVLAAACAFTFLYVPVAYVYPEKQGYNQAFEPYLDSGCIYVISGASGTWHIHDEAARLVQFSAVYFVSPNALDKRMQNLAEKGELCGQCVLFIDLMDYARVDFDAILEATDYTRYHELYTTEYNAVVLLE